MTLDGELTKLEQEILAEGERIRKVAGEEVLKIRKSRLVQELEDIEDKLAALLDTPIADPAPKKTPAKAPAKKST